LGTAPLPNRCAGCSCRFYDVHSGNTNQTDPAIPGYAAGSGWDPVTGLGTPNAAALLPDLVVAAHQP